MDNRLAYLQEEYALSFEKAANDYPAIDDPEAAKREIQDLKRKNRCDWTSQFECYRAI